ncbi:hypothetical protein M407DRAFT_30105 [Tulasnella calospora MUT 4182]|uniref:Uncharacterized protein n=1 Tax=Tulasnella calospora MUT 4182 TaxID=1051891 RepID=A0A0C3Q8V4_9AGAM|nr:hypothetical protein M407DRAFT_30105 [Tulasnella calospora MUT 4182]
MGLLIVSLISGSRVVPAPAAAFSTVSVAARPRSAVYGRVVGSRSLLPMVQSAVMGGIARPSNVRQPLVPIKTPWTCCCRSHSQYLFREPKGIPLVRRYSAASNPEYPGINAYLQLVQNRVTSNPDYVQLFVFLSQLRTYITTTDTNGLRSNTLRDWFIAAMEEANRMNEIIKADQPVKDADLAFRAEMLTLLGQQKMREDEAKAKVGADARTRKIKRWLAAGTGAALVTVGTVAVAPAAAVGALGLIGFSSLGPVAGSIAAITQSVVYGGAVASGSLFAIFQSAAMGGIVVGSAAQVSAGIAALGAGAGLLGGTLRGSNKGDDDAAGSKSGDGPRTN